MGHNDTHKGDTTVGRLAWHVHHEVLFEVLCEPLQNRRDYIRFDKPAHEHAVRLDRLRLVDMSGLPSELEAGLAEVNRRRAESDRLSAESKQLRAESICRLRESTWRRRETTQQRKECDWLRAESIRLRTESDRLRAESTRLWAESYRLWAETVDQHRGALIAAHAIQCPDCPWNGETLFPQRPRESPPS